MWTPPPIEAREVAREVSLPDQRVAVVGDVHGNFRWLDIVARSIQRLAPDVTTILQLGDWAMDPDTTLAPPFASRRLRGCCHDLPV